MDSEEIPTDSLVPVSSQINKPKRESPANGFVFIAHVKEADHNKEVLDIDELKACVLLLEDTFRKNGAIKYIFQYELGVKGEQYHFQGWFAFKPKVKKRWTKFKCWPGMSFIAARGTTHENGIYCSKDATKIAGPWYWGMQLPRELDTFLHQELHNWQKLLVEQFKNDCPKRNREIWWFWEEEGNVGKSVLATYLVDNHDAMVCKGTDKDVCYSIKQWKDDKGEVPVSVVIDLARSSTKAQIPYATMEDCKNGTIYSAKYESGMLRIAPMHVIVFSNFPPDRSKFSHDRWKVINLNEWIMRLGEQAAINLI